MEKDYELIIERHPDGTPKVSVIHDVEAFKHDLRQHPPMVHPSYKPPVDSVSPAVPTSSDDQQPVESPPPDSYEMRRQKVISACPHRSYKKYTAVDNELKIEHLFRDGTPAEGCGCSTMKCRIGKGKDGNVTIDDCTKCVTEAGLLDEEESPGLLQMAKNFITSMINHAKTGMKYATPEQKEERLSICRACPKFDDGQCRVCGCFLDWKTSLAAEQCPMDPPRWLSIPPNQSEE